MPEQIDSDPSTAKSGPEVIPTPDPGILLSDLVAAKAQAASLIESINADAKIASAQCSDIQKGRLSAEAANTEMETHLSLARSQEQQLKQLLDTASATNNDLAGLRSSMEVAAKQTTETNAQALAALESIRAAATTAADASSRAEASRTQVEQAASVSATKSEHIEHGRVHADDIRAKLDTLLTQVQQSATNAEAQHQAARSTAENVTSLHVAAQATKSNIDALGEAVSAIRNQADAHLVATKRLADIAERVDASVTLYENRLAELQQAASDRLKQIEDLLLGATNAGLAHAFDKRSKTFVWPERIWQSLFFASIIGLLGLAGLTVHNGDGIPQYSELARMLLQRLPFLVPLVWLAIHAARQASLAKRMEEEYAFKATISTSFEGYRRELAEISKDLPDASPLARLCNETLRTIGAPPGHVYEKHRMDPTPGTAVAELVSPVTTAVSKVIAEKLPPPK